jgi:hypothetical protein
MMPGSLMEPEEALVTGLVWRSVPPRDEARRLLCVRLPGPTPKDFAPPDQ